MIPINASQLPQIYKQALALQQRGDTDKAVALFGQILSVNPNIAEVHFQLGRIAMDNDQLNRAVEHFFKALSIKPKEATLWSQTAEAVARLGDNAIAAKFLKNAKLANLPPKLLIAVQDRVNKRASKSKSNIGPLDPAVLKTLIDKLNAGQVDQVVSEAGHLLQRHPGVAILSDILASALVGAGRVDDALAQYQRTLAIDPDYAETYSNIGRLLVELDRLDDAMPYLREALRRIPDATTVRLNLAIALLRKGEEAEAISLLTGLATKEPNKASVWKTLGEAHLKRFNATKSLQALERANNLQPDDIETLMALGQAYSFVDQPDAARQCYDRVVEIEPDNALVQGRLGALEQNEGDFDAAQRHFVRAIELKPDYTDIYRLYATGRKMKIDDPMVARMEAVWQDTTLEGLPRSELGFALSKTYEDLGEYTRAFEILKRSNDLVHEVEGQDMDAFEARIHRLLNAQDTPELATRKVAEASDYAPIFVTGLPRSGTTLTEQIIASHSTVTGAGELDIFSKRVQMALRSKTPGAPMRKLSELDDQEIADIGLGYETELCTLQPDAQRVTDKSILTYQTIGAVPMALPNARIIVVRRDPRDNLLSIYRNRFPTDTHPYAYDLQALARQYKLFCRVIDFWRERVPDAFYELHYEDLIANPEVEVRKLIDACGLDWEDACLNFHQTERSVKTLSVYQVRQPIYKSSMKAWQRYETELAPLFAALEEDD